MQANGTVEFTAPLEIIGVNPFVSVPEDILQEIFRVSGKDKGTIPICGTVNGKPYKQTLLRYSGAWRLYVNTAMLKNAPGRIGETVTVTAAFDPTDRSIAAPPKLVAALEANSEAKAVFDGLSPSRKHEIVRYIAALKSEESVEKNVKKAIDFLCGKGRFVGRDKPN
jgi:hypothetical protein